MSYQLVLLDNSTCADQKTEANFTIYYDMHKFEGQEWIPPSIQSEESIKRMQLERFQRIKHCDHTWNNRDYLIKDMCE
jgi:hypothetical protein